MAVVTISGQYGTGGETLGKMISEKLEYTFADRNITQRVAEEANVSPNWVKLVETEGGTKLSKLITTMVSQKWMDRVLSNDKGYIDEKIYLDYLVLIIAQIADEGNAVILGRGSQYILNDHPEAFHVLLVNNVENRINFLVDRYEITEKKAAHAVENEDKRRLSLYKKLGKSDYDDPSLYHMVLNMEKFTLKSALDQVIHMIGDRG